MSLFDRFKSKPATDTGKAESTPEVETPVAAPQPEEVQKEVAAEAPQPEQPVARPASAADCVRVLLQQLNCEFKEEDRPHSSYFIFDYQGGHFRIDAGKQMNALQIEYPLIYDTEAENLNIVRMFCNEMNFRTRFSRFLYQYVEDKHRVALHIFTGVTLPDGEEERRQMFKGVLESHFALQRDFCKRLEERLKSEEKPQDIEVEVLHDRRLRYLLSEQELMHQQIDTKVRASVAGHVTVGELVKEFYREDMVLEELRVVTDNLLIMSGNETIQNFNVLSPLLEGEGEHVQLKADEVTLIVKGERESVTIQVTPTVEAEKAIYFRVNMMCPGLHLDVRRQKMDLDSYSFLLVYDKVSQENYEAEFRYMWEDARAKLAAKNFKEMTPEQQFICDVDSRKLAADFYWAKKYFEEKRCVEALCHLKVVYKELNANFHQLEQPVQELFYQACFMMGFCYNELQQYQKAYFYLDIVFRLQRMADTIEYVNCLTNSDDFRAIYVIDNLLQGLQQADEQQDEDEEEAEKPKEQDPNLQIMVNFLRRRKAFVLIGLRMYDEAEKLLQELLKEPVNADYALGELAYLQQLKGNKAGK